MGASAAAIWTAIGSAISGSGAAAGTAAAAEGAAAAGTAAAGGGIGSAIAQGAAGAAVGAGLSKLMQPKIPGIKGPTAMPNPDELAIGAKQEMLRKRQSGRQSTILSQPETLG